MSDIDVQKDGTPPITEQMKVERVVVLKELKRVTEKNLNIVKRSKFDQKIVMAISTFAFLFGAAFLTLNVTEKYANVLNIVVNFLSGAISGGALISNVKSVFESNADSIFSKKLSIGPPEIDDKVADVLNSDKNIIGHAEEVKEAKKIIDNRNKHLRFSSVYGSMVVIIGSVVAIVLIGINIHYSLANKKYNYFYVVNILLIAGGVHCLFRSITMHLALLSSDFFFKRQFLIYVFFLHLFLNCLICINTNGVSDLEKGKKEEEMKEDIAFFFGKLVLRRVCLATNEKRLINRLLHGLRLEELEDFKNIGINK